ncbi:hypothetical protein BKA81DRAFT_356294 [Phyllosticta paracitricarpa]
MINESPPRAVHPPSSSVWPNGPTSYAPKSSDCAPTTSARTSKSKADPINSPRSTSSSHGKRSESTT